MLPTPLLPPWALANGLAERVMLDALATHLEQARACEVLERMLCRRRTRPRDSSPAAVANFLHDHFGTMLAKEFGGREAKEIALGADALLAPLLYDAMIASCPAFRAPYVLVSDEPCSLEDVIEMRRATTLVDALLDADVMPRATLVVDMYSTSLSPFSLGLAAIDLPHGMHIVIVGASEAERALFEEVSTRGATFVERFPPLDLRAKPPPSAARRAAACCARVSA